MTPRWTMELPTMEGFYWVREPYQPHMPHPLQLGRPRVVELCGDTPDELRLYDAGVDMAERVESCRVVWWLGPLEAPEMPDPRRAAVQGDYRRGGRAYGTIEWWEHEEAWLAYSKRYGTGQSAERIHERAGFGYDELVELLGREPTTWRPRS